MTRTTQYLTGIAFSAAMALSAQAGAESLCTNRTSVLQQLSNKFSEAPVAAGLANNGGVVEVLSSKTGKTWTIIITMPNGKSCMVAAGEGWEIRAKPLIQGRPASYRGS